MVNFLAHQNIDDAVTSRRKAFLISTQDDRRVAYTSACRSAGNEPMSHITIAKITALFFETFPVT